MNIREARHLKYAARYRKKLERKANRVTKLVRLFNMYDYIKRENKISVDKFFNK